MTAVRFIAVSAAAVALFAGSAGLAHPRLVAANPSPNATVAAPRALQLRFSERLVGRFSSAELAALGANGGASRIGGVTARLGADGKTLAIVPAGPLRPGSYRLTWRVVSADTHRAQGAYAFRVK